MMRFICGDTPFELNFHILSPGQHGVIYEDDSLTVECFLSITVSRLSATYSVKSRSPAMSAAT